MSNNFRYVRLKTEDATFFQPMDPFERLGFLDLYYGFAIGVLFDEGESIEPVGLLVGTANEERISIEWLVVMPEYQYRGIGEELLRIVFEMASKGKIPEVCVAMLPDMERERFTRGAKGYFEERLFTRKEEIGADTYCQILDFESSKTLKKTTDVPCESFADMTGHQVWECIERLSQIENATYSFQPKGFVSKLDSKLCFVSMAHGKVEAAFLVANMGDFLLPVYYYAKTDDLGMGVIASAVLAGAKKYGKSKYVLVMARQPETVALAENLLGTLERGEMLIASTKEYEKERASDIMY